jgi:peptidyl-prolyl cis-trans isomerase C
MSLRNILRASIAPLLLAVAAIASAAPGAPLRTLLPFVPTVLATTPAPHTGPQAESAEEEPPFLADSVQLARFDEKIFTVHDYVWSYYSSYAGDRPAHDSLGRIAFLKALINKELLGRTARKVGYDLGYEGRVQMREFTQRVLSNFLFQRVVIDSAEASEADVQHVYEQFKTSLHLRRILFADRATADRVRIQLVGGRIAWTDAVKKYSIATADRGNDGDFGWVLRPSLEYDLAEAVYALKPGQISPVIEDMKGPQILQCTEIRAVKPPSLDAVSGTIKNQIRNLRITTNASRLQNVLRAHVGFVPDTANVRWASAFFPIPHTMETEGGISTMSFDVSIPVIAPEDTSRVLATWQKGGRLSLGEFMIAFSDIPPLIRPACNTPQALEFQVANIALEPYKAQAAIDRGYDKDPLVVAEIEMRRERLFVERMYNDSIATYVQVSKEERRREYDANPKIYSLGEEREFATIQRYSKAGADSLVALLKTGRPAIDVIRADSAAGFVSGAVHVMRNEEHGNWHKIVFEEMKPGDITTSMTDRNGGTAVIQLIRVSPPRRLTMDEAQAQIDETLRDRKAEDMLQAWLKRLSRGHQITMHPEKLHHIRMVDPTML